MPAGEDTKVKNSTRNTPPDTPREPPPPERITVALIPKAVTDLQLLQDRTGLSKTDIVNRAITLYEYIEGQLRQDNDILIRDKNTEHTQTVKLL
jgi:hypothetical protein